MQSIMNYQTLWHQLAKHYDEGEAKAIARMVYEVRYGLSLSDLYMGRDEQVPQDELQEIVTRLEDDEPVQYVLGQATFCGRSFHVEPGVLIPRPETEELCRWAVSHSRQSATILDIGTGSGCIAVTLALEVADSQVTAWDISPIALRIASENAERLGANVTFIENDMLQQSYQIAPQWDLIVSNPPYICDSEADDMKANVLDYEPEIALFVPDDNPLLFYRPIMNYAQSALHPGGQLFLETNPRYEEFIEEHLLELGFEEVESRDDQFGKTRFIRARR